VLSVVSVLCEGTKTRTNQPTSQHTTPSPLATMPAGLLSFTLPMEPTGLLHPAPNAWTPDGVLSVVSVLCEGM
jgi:hypothetical protein